jgi:hypothetical protein
MRREYDRRKKGKQKDYIGKVLEYFLKSQKKRRMERVENLRQRLGWLWHELMNFTPDFLDPV